MFSFRLRHVPFQPKLLRNSIDSFNSEIYTFGHPVTQEQIIHVQFKRNTGQIGLIYVHELYRKQGLAKWTIKLLEDEFRLHGLDEIWVACSKDHYYWSKQKDFHYRNPSHPSVTGEGYYKSLSPTE